MEIAIRKFLLLVVLPAGYWFASCQGQRQEPSGTTGRGVTGAGAVETEFTTDYLMGHFDPARHPDFTEVAAQHGNRSGLFLRKDAYEAFVRMYEAAQKDGVRLIIISAARNFDYQKGIWEAKWTGARAVEGMDLTRSLPNPQERALKILEYSSMPGSSRHHWGTDMDLNSLEPAYFKAGAGKKIYDWLSEHAHVYGFCQPYSAKGAERPEGYNEEHWHWSYTPVSGRLTKLAQEKLKNDMIRGFKGSETAGEIDIVGKYVLGINRDCL